VKLRTPLVRDGRRVVAATLTAAVLGLVAACGTQAPAAPASGAPTPTPKSPPVALSVAYSPPAADSAYAFAALDGGYFAKNGLKVKLVSVNSSVAVSSVVSDSTPFAAVASSGGTIAAMARGANIRAIFSVENKPTIVLVSAKDIATLKDLRGKTVGVAQPFSVTDILMRRLLADSGLTYNRDVHVRYLANLGGLAAALVKGQVQAVTVTADVAQELVHQGFKLLVNVPQQNLALTQTEALVNESYAKQHHAVVEAFVRSLWEGTQGILSNYSLYASSVQRHVKGITAAQMKYYYGIVAQPVWGEAGNPSVNVNGVKTVLQVIGPKIGVSPADASHFIDNRYVAALDG
jgi:ABC-type nitrate/sulfonate/bicarbonate transport system substrate-binding protein